MRTKDEMLQDGLYRLLENNIYRYRKFERGLEMIDKQELFLAKPSSLNDPFDCYEGLIKFKMTKEFVEKEMRPIMKSKGITRAVRKRMELDILQNRNSTIYDEYFKSYKDNFGVCCFSWKCDNIVLWANYTDNHTGICLGFKGLSPVQAGLYGIYPVYYTPDIKKYTFTSFEDERYWQHWLTTKAKDWEYENEVRLISKSHNGILKFSKENLTEIFLGLYITEENKKKVIDSLIRNNYSHDTKVYRMAIDKKSFSLRWIEIKWRNKKASHTK